MIRRLHLREFLRTGDFFGFGSTTPRDDVQAILGPPGDTGLVTRKYRRPRIWVYGGIELTFGPNEDAPLEMIHMDHPNLPPQGSESLTIDPWRIAEGMSFEELHRVCRDEQIQLSPAEWNGMKAWVTSGRVYLLFSEDTGDDETGLAAIWRSFRSNDFAESRTIA